MSNRREDASPMNGAAIRELGTFSSLPEMDRTPIRKRVESIVSRRLIPVIEHVEPDRASECHRSPWKVPLFGEESRRRHPRGNRNLPTRPTTAG